MIPSALILSDPSVCLRWLAMRDLFSGEIRTGDLDELRLLRNDDPLVKDLVSTQLTDGSWQPKDISAGWGAGGKILATGYALTRLGYLGFDKTSDFARRGFEFLKATQQADGSWPLVEGNAGVDGRQEEENGYSWIPLQTAIPLRGLASIGAAEEEFCERAYQWLLSKRLDDGSWPTGWSNGVHGYVAGYRRLAHSRWGCRSNTTGVLECLALHPRLKHSAEARKALDLLLGREIHDSGPNGFDVARLVGIEPISGFFTYYKVYDLAQILSLCWRLEISSVDERVKIIQKSIEGKVNKFGLWPYPQHPQAMRWISFDISRSILRLSDQTGWMGEQPRTPFKAYGKKQKRF